MLRTRSRAVFRAYSHSISQQTILSAQRPYVFWVSREKASHKPSPEDSADSSNGFESSQSTSEQSSKYSERSLKNIESSLVSQSPNRASIWSRSQNPRSKAMSGPRFEQTLFEFQPAPHAAIELSHKQPVQWSNQRIVSCDGGGGPLGHPRVFINIDKPEINVCGYCSRPFAHEHHRKQIETLPISPYPLAPPSKNA